LEQLHYTVGEDYDESNPMSCSGVVMTTPLAVLVVVVTLTLTLVASPSHQSPHHTQRQAPSQLLHDTRDPRQTLAPEPTSYPASGGSQSVAP